MRPPCRFADDRRRIAITKLDLSALGSIHLSNGFLHE
jgi:hypothetical protein